jgi:hypothetical protein
VSTSSACDARSAPGIPQPPRKPGPGRKPLPIADLVFAVILKVFTTLSSRRAQSDLRENAARGNLGTVGHFNMLTRFLADAASTLLLTSLIEESAAPMRMLENGQYAIDSTEFSTVTYDRWFDQGTASSAPHIRG